MLGRIQLTERGENLSPIFLGVIFLIGLILIGLFIWIIVLIILALLKYLKAKEIRKEKTLLRKSLGEVLKAHRILSKMTQEFVAERIGVSRQAVSKWENGSSDPSTTNLIAIAKLYGISVEELLNEMG